MESLAFQAAVFLLLGLELAPGVIQLAAQFSLLFLGLGQLLFEGIDLRDHVNLGLEQPNLAARVSGR